jgi:hypothetical protein
MLDSGFIPRSIITQPLNLAEWLERNPLAEEEEKKKVLIVPGRQEKPANYLPIAPVTGVTSYC